MQRVVEGVRASTILGIYITELILLAKTIVAPLPIMPTLQSLSCNKGSSAALVSVTVQNVSFARQECGASLGDLPARVVRTILIQTIVPRNNDLPSISGLIETG